MTIKESAELLVNSIESENEELKFDFEPITESNGTLQVYFVSTKETVSFPYVLTERDDNVYMHIHNIHLRTQNGIMPEIDKEITAMLHFLKYDTVHLKYPVVKES